MATYHVCAGSVTGETTPRYEKKRHSSPIRRATFIALVSFFLIRIIMQPTL